MYITVEKFFKLFKYLSYFGYGTKAFNAENVKDVLSIMNLEAEIEDNWKVGFDLIIKNYIILHDLQTKESKELVDKFNSYCDPDKFDILKSDSVRSSIYDEKFKVNIFPAHKNECERVKNELLFLITDLKLLGLGGFEKQFDIIDCNMTIIKTQKQKLDNNQREYETRKISEANAKSAGGS